MHRTPSIQTISWFANLKKNGQLDLSPPYQRKSFWNQSYREFFIDTILNGFPTNAVFLFQAIDDNGDSMYHVVDGKQRLETILSFVTNEFPVPASFESHAGENFKDLPPELRRRIWDYQLSVEHVPDTSEAYLRSIFDRINRNVAKLKPQELRHARFEGAFIQLAERTAQLFADGFPSISDADRKRMRDVEYASTLLVFLVKGEVSVSQTDLDELYSDWDEELPEANLESLFRLILRRIAALAKDKEAGSELRSSRFKNLADYFSLFGAIVELEREGKKWSPARVSAKLVEFAKRVESAREANDETDSVASRYYEAARSASNDPGPRRLRIDTIKKIVAKRS